jgi:hypothetical protein
MVREITLAGYQLTGDEWQALDERSRLQLLRALLEGAGYVPDDEPYESYELVA